MVADLGRFSVGWRTGNTLLVSGYADDFTAGRYESVWAATGRQPFPAKTLILTDTYQ
ncbi:hypothetical protein [Methylocaldum sp. RMAD-M]|uniref:hypothetical protein n=1 Tax=Methylocaldum sp. RMAD-M TaxID=2806557 RepID=UPI001AE60449|nr:hypothetical protein [Methylocaldum sp. RMAD-M]MDV3242533.1 hypothetical protein [Methylocaldum sp.]